jgi:hypothetical protein
MNVQRMLEKILQILSPCAAKFCRPAILLPPPRRLKCSRRASWTQQEKAEAVFGPVLVATMLLPYIVAPPLVQQIRAEGARAQGV